MGVVKTPGLDRQPADGVLSQPGRARQRIELGAQLACVSCELDALAASLGAGVDLDVNSLATQGIGQGISAGRVGLAFDRGCGHRDPEGVAMKARNLGVFRAWGDVDPERQTIAGFSQRKIGLRIDQALPGPKPAAGSRRVAGIVFSVMSSALSRLSIMATCVSMVERSADA